jgi:signal transduction histidine kinase
MPLFTRQASLENLLEILGGTTDPHTALQQGLRFLIDDVGCQGAALFIQGEKPDAEYTWLAEAVPLDWQVQFQAATSPLYHAVREITRTKEPVGGNPNLHLIGGIPLEINREPVGGILFFNESRFDLPLDDLKPLARMLALLISRNPQTFSNSSSYDFAFCELIASTQNIYLGLQEIQARVVDGIQTLINPDEICLYYYYPEKNHLIEKIEYNLNTGRVEQSFINRNRSIVGQTIAEKKSQTVLNLEKYEFFNPEIDGSLQILATMAIYLPMIANSEAVGVVGLLFKQPISISSYQHNMLNTIVTALGFAIINSRHIQQLRVVNADVEANRWEIMRSRNILRALFDSLPSSIYIIDQTSRIVAANVSRARRENVHPMQLVGKKCYEALYNRSETCPGCLVNETLFAGSNTSRHSRIWIDDQPVDWEISTFVVLNDQNQPGQAIIIEQDVTEKRRLETNLIQSEKLAAVGQLAAGVVHEINNPLAAIIANAQILERDLDGNEDLLESVKLIELAGMRASQVVKNLLGFARKEQYDFEPVDLNETIAKAVQLLQHKLVSQSVQLKQDLEENLPAILASRDHLEGVWVNLMINALDAMRDQAGRLAVTSRFANNEFRVTITDNGQGIPPERINHIFEPFYTTKGFNQGTGLGLSICHRIIKNHGGYITVDSQVGEGTKFTVVLPSNNRPSQAKSQGA